MAEGMDANVIPPEGYVDAFVIGVTGQLHGKREPSRNLPRLLRDGLNMSACALLFDARGVNPLASGIGVSDGDPDACARSIADIAPVAWARQPTWQCLMELVEASTGKAFWYDPRTVLKNVVGALNNDGLFPAVAFELEFYLIDARRAADGGIQSASISRTSAMPVKESNFDVALIEDYAEFIAAVMHAAKLQRLPLSTIVSEYGVGQFEINMEHDNDLLRAADQTVLLRRLITGVARAQGMDATFMAKPFFDQPGSGMHVHVSLQDQEGQNAMGRDDNILRHAVAGLQRALPESMSFFAPNFASYRRLKPRMFVPIDASWGRNNRSVAFRIPIGPAQSRRVEHRVAGADACPHLVLAAILAGMHAGITGKWLPTQEAAAAGRDAQDPMPRNLLESLHFTKAGSLLEQYMPRQFLNVFLDNRLGEFEALTIRPSRAEYDFYL